MLKVPISASLRVPITPTHAHKGYAKNFILLQLLFYESFRVCIIIIETDL